VRVVRNWRGATIIMILVKPSIKFMWMTDNPLNKIEEAGRVAYKSEARITSDSVISFVKMLLKNGHESVLEHASMSYKVICDRGVSHEIVRHRLFSYTQESTRYCNYKSGVTFIIPSWLDIAPGEYKGPDDFLVTRVSTTYLWFYELLRSETAYTELLKMGWVPQQARSVLPNALKTEIVITGNFREWRHFFKLRTAKEAHPQMQEVAKMILEDITKKTTVIFDEYLENL
jgi:thymidylate synthase (FAD)